MRLRRKWKNAICVLCTRADNLGIFHNPNEVRISSCSHDIITP